MIAIENAACPDYITEKFWRPLVIGVVPIYFGSPTIKASYFFIEPGNVLIFYFYFSIGNQTTNQPFTLTIFHIHVHWPNICTKWPKIRLSTIRTYPTN